MGFQSITTFAASSHSDVNKNIDEIKSIRSLNTRNSKFSQLDVQRILNKTSSIGFHRSSAEKNYKTETEPNDFFDQADPLTLGTGIVGNFSYHVNRYGDFDSFQIQVTQQGYLLILEGLARVDYNTKLGFGLFDTKSQIVNPVDSSIKDGIAYEVMDVEPGTYYIATANLNEMVSYDQYLLYADMLDTTAPDAPKVNPIDDHDKVISGKAEAYAKITIKNGSKLFSTVNADKYGNFKLSIKPLKSGTKLTFTAADKYNNVSKAVTVTVADKTPPVLTVNKLYSTSSFISGKTEAKVSLTVKVGSKTIGSGSADSSGYFKLKIQPQKKNTILAVTAKDSSGNQTSVKIKVI